MDFDKLQDEEKYLFEAIMSARALQEFLWGECNKEWGIEEWKRMFRKRSVKIDDIQADNPHALIELRKRVLQNTALGIALLKIIDSPNVLSREECPIPSNLPQYKE